MSRLLFGCPAFRQWITDCSMCFRFLVGWFLLAHIPFPPFSAACCYHKGNPWGCPQMQIKCAATIRCLLPHQPLLNGERHLDYGLLAAQKLAVILIGQDRWIGLHPAGLPHGKLLCRQIRTKKTDTCLKGLRPSALEPSRWFMGV